MAPFVNSFNNNLLQVLKDKYFNTTDCRINLNKGEVLLQQNQPNHRLFLVIDGELSGQMHRDTDATDQVFIAGKDSFVGVHSFFSSTERSYAEVVATKVSELAYIDEHAFNGEEKKQLMADFVPVIVHELSSRQKLAQQFMSERENIQKKLFQSEKMATLGQMAAGLAHELNNAIGVIQGNTEWMADEICKELEEQSGELAVKYFKTGLSQGATVSTKDARRERKELIKRYNLSEKEARKLAKIGLSYKELAENKSKDIQKQFSSVYKAWELGCTTHDMLLASTHSRHVLKSVKQLAVANQERQFVVLEHTITESLTLLKSLVRQVDVECTVDDTIQICANHGELVQVWINLIKNACESMLNAKTVNPKLHIRAHTNRKNVVVTVSDNGPGVPQDMRNKIFQPNFTTKKDGLSFGLGLGLAIVQRLIESYHGKIQAVSNNELTEFKVTLPLNKGNGKN